MHSAGPAATGVAGDAGATAGAEGGGLDVVVGGTVLVEIDGVGGLEVDVVAMVAVVAGWRVVDVDAPVAAASWPAPSSRRVAAPTAAAVTRTASRAAAAIRRGRRVGRSRLARCCGVSGMAASLVSARFPSPE